MFKPDDQHIVIQVLLTFAYHNTETPTPADDMTAASENVDAAEYDAENAPDLPGNVESTATQGVKNLPQDANDEADFLEWKASPRDELDDQSSSSTSDATLTTTTTTSSASSSDSTTSAEATATDSASISDSTPSIDVSSVESTPTITGTDPVSSFLPEPTENALSPSASDPTDNGVTIAVAGEDVDDNAVVVVVVAPPGDDENEGNESQSYGDSSDSNDMSGDSDDGTLPSVSGDDQDQDSSSDQQPQQGGEERFASLDTETSEGGDSNSGDSEPLYAAPSHGETPSIVAGEPEATAVTSSAAGVPALPTPAVPVALPTPPFPAAQPPAAAAPPLPVSPPNEEHFADFASETEDIVPTVGQPESDVPISANGEMPSIIAGNPVFGSLTMISSDAAVPTPPIPSTLPLAAPTLPVTASPPSGAPSVNGIPVGASDVPAPAAPTVSAPVTVP